MTGWWLALIAVLYVSVLFWVASYGDHSDINNNKSWRSIIYSLSLAVYCSSWTFFGAVGQASSEAWSFVPIYLGPVILFIFFWKLLSKLILVSKKENITSIADFIASRHGKSRGLAMVVTLILVIGILPYIALQLKAIVLGFELLSVGSDTQWRHQDLALGVTLLLAIFVIIFGTRRIDTTEHQHGVMTAIAFESILKLIAFLIVGLWICWKVYNDSGVEISRSFTALSSAPDSWLHDVLVPTMMSMAAVICLPRQFHAMVVENGDIRDFYKARWLFSLYLVLTAVFVLPLATAGNTLLGARVPADGYVIALPKLLGSESMAVLSYMGGVSAAISMVILATIALSTMVSNECLMPLILRHSDLGRRDQFQFGGMLLNMRRSIILVLLLMAYVVYRVIDSGGLQSGLAGLGQLSFGAVVQLIPAVVGGLYLQESNRKAVSAGLLSGFAIWFYALIIPFLVQAGWIGGSILRDGLWGMAALKPQALFGLPITDSVTGATVLAFFVNSFLYCFGCLYFSPDAVERRHARSFLDTTIHDTESYRNVRVTLNELHQLISRYVGDFKAVEMLGKEQSGNQKFASRETLAAVERYLSGVMGATSAKVVMKSMLVGGRVGLQDVEAIVDEASEVFQFNRELLHGAIESIGQGISVVDKELRLVAWNHQYLELFNYPEGLIVVGKPVAEIIRYNACNGLYGPGDPEEHVRKRVAYMREGTVHKSERCHEDGRVIEIRGNPMPGGGFVMSFTDITEFRLVEQALKDVNESLEQRVEVRTRELHVLNQQLLEAKAQAESANRSRSRFFAAVSHDLMQPMNAARLFAASLEASDQSPEARQLTMHLSGSLHAAERLLKDILDMSRLEAGKLRATIREFSLTEVLKPLESEFRLQATDEALDFRMLGSQNWVKTDPNLLRRILQNFLTNAFRYCDSENGRVMMNVRHWPHNRLCIEVRDNGSGIPEEQQELIFTEFQRLRQDSQGLGLGLAIAKGVADVLGLSLGVRSRIGQGTVFSVQLRAVERQVIQQQVLPVTGTSLVGLKVLCIDNEAEILLGMSSLLGRWGCQVQCAETCQQAITATQEFQPDIMLVDYQLEDELDGVELVQRLRKKQGRQISSVLITANSHAVLKDECRSLHISYLTKPVKPAALRALLNSVAQSSFVEEELSPG